VTHVRADNPPTFAQTIPSDHIDGTTLKKPHGESHQSKRGAERRHPHHL
jgi:hypothetical protein